MQRTSLIAAVAATTLLVAGVAWAGAGGTDDVTALAVADDSPSPDDAPTPDDDPTPDDTPTPDDDPTPHDDATPDDTPTPDDDPTPHGEDQPVDGTIVATHRAVDAGAVTVAAQGLRVELVEVVPADGWRVEVESDGGLEVEVSFRREGARVDLKAEVDDGQLRFRVRDRRVEERTEAFVDSEGRETLGEVERDEPEEDDRDDDDDDDDSVDDDSMDDDDSVDDSDD